MIKLDGHPLRQISISHRLMTYQNPRIARLRGFFYCLISSHHVSLHRGVTLGVTDLPPRGVIPMSLTDTAIRNTKSSKDKALKLFDEKGLFLLVTPSGGKWWRFKYQFWGKEKLLSLSTYPDVRLKGIYFKFQGHHKIR